MPQPEYLDFFEEIPADNADAPADPVDEPKDEPARAHILTPEELEEWKNGSDKEPVLKRAADVKSEEEPDKPKDPEPPKEEAKVPAAPVATSTVSEPSLPDPGEYEPKDYSFQVTVYDPDGKNPKQVTINSVEEFDDLLEKDSNFGSYAALAKAQRAADKMEANSERDQAEWEKAKAAYDAEQEQINTRVEGLENIYKEIVYLQSKGDLPKISNDLMNANWSDPEVAAHPEVKATQAVLEYMQRESETRRKAGLPPLTSAIDAFNAMQLEQARKGQTDQARKAADARKAAGARVGGSQPAQATNVPKGISVGRVVDGGIRGL